MSRILTAYFSWSGCCEKLAAAAGAETAFRIRTVKPYSSHFIVTAWRAGWEKLTGARPQLVSLPERTETYDAILLIYPVWCSSCPRAVLTFLESIDTKEKVIQPVCCSGSGHPGSSVRDIRKACPDAQIRDELSFLGKMAGSEGARRRLKECIEKI